jgi:hypothetical protein
LDWGRYFGQSPATGQMTRDKPNVLRDYDLVCNGVWSIWLSIWWSESMPTLAKAQLTESEFPWGATYDRIYLQLCQDRISILTALGFYAEHRPRRIQAPFRPAMKPRNYVK